MSGGVVVEALRFKVQALERRLERSKHLARGWRRKAEASDLAAAVLRRVISSQNAELVRLRRAVRTFGRRASR